MNKAQSTILLCAWLRKVRTVRHQRFKPTYLKPFKSQRANLKRPSLFSKVKLRVEAKHRLANPTNSRKEVTSLPNLSNTSQCRAFWTKSQKTNASILWIWSVIRPTLLEQRVSCYTLIRICQFRIISLLRRKMDKVSHFRSALCTWPWDPSRAVIRPTRMKMSRRRRSCSSTFWWSTRSFVSHLWPN